MKAKSKAASKLRIRKANNRFPHKNPNRHKVEESLREYQAILATAEEVAEIGSWKWDLRTQKVTWSEGMFHLFGVKREGFDGDVNRVVAERVHPDDIPAVMESNRRVLEEANPIPLSYRIVLPDGTERTVWAQGQFVRDEMGKAIALTGYVQDITETVRAEKKIIQLKRLYATLSQVNQMNVRVKEREELFQTICDVAVKFGEFTLAWVGIVDDSSGDVIPVAANGFDVNEWPLPIVNIHTGSLSDELVAQAIHSSNVVVSGDVQAEKHLQILHNPFDQYGFHASAVIPFRLRDRTIGILTLISHEIGLFKDVEEVRLLDEMGLDISFALDNMENEKERELAEEALRESEERYRGLFDHMAEGYAYCQMLFENGLAQDWVYCDTNEAFETLTGLKNAKGKRVSELLPGIRKTDPELFAIYARVALTGKHEKFEMFVQALQQWFSVSVYSPQKEFFVAVFDVITQRKQAEAEVLSLAKFPSENPNPILRVAKDGTITYANTASDPVLKVWGCPMGQRLSDVPGQLVSAALQSGKFQELEVVCDERIYSVLFVPILNEGYVNLYGRDMTKRKRAEAQIQRQLEHLNSLRKIDAAISSSFEMSLVLNVVLQEAYSQLGVDACAVLLYDAPSQIIKYAASRGFHFHALHHTKLTLGEGYAGEAVLKRKTVHISDLMELGGKLASALQLEQESFVDYYGAPLIVKGEVKGVLEIYHRSRLQADSEWLEFLETLARQAAIAIDNAQLFENLQRSNATLERRVAERTAELHRTNAELEHANRAKDEFLANMSHELRTPLNTILGLSESLLEQRRGPLNQKQTQSIDLIASSGKHLLGLINDILEVSKIEAGKLQLHPSLVSVKELCESSLNFIRELAVKKQISMEFNHEESVSILEADPQRLKQILINLLTNAVKFTPERGKVSLHVYANTEGNQILLSVADTGIGIEPLDLKKLFTPFTQLDSSLARQYPGTGLGLVLVQKLTEMHGGSVQVESEVGKGSRFTIALPLSQNSEEKTSSESVMESRSTKQDTMLSSTTSKEHGIVLLAEDNEINSGMLADYLEEQGYKVVSALNGEEVLAKVEEAKPDIILMDIQMPKMDGLEATRRLRANPRFKSTPIVALTALVMPGDRERCLEAGVNEYMSKPVSLKMLVKTIESLLETGTTSGKE